MDNLAAYSGWIGHRNIGDEAICQAVQRLFPDLEFSDIEFANDRDVIIYGGGTIFPSVVSRESEYSDDAFTAAIGVGARNPEFWNQRFSPLDFGYYTGTAVNSDRLNVDSVNKLLYRLTKTFDSFWSYNKTLTNQDFAAVRDADIDFLGVRGPDSSALLDYHGIDHEIVGDTALALEPTSYHSPDRSRVAVTLRDNTYGWATNKYHEDVIEFCKRHADEHEFVFTPFWPPDIDVCLEAAYQVPGSSFRDYCSCIDIQGTIDEFARCDLVIADKLHANVLSACSYTPFISLEYRPKNADFAKSVDMADFNKRTDEVDVTWLQDRFERIQSTDCYQETLRNNVESYRDSLQKFACRITYRLEDNL